MTKGHHRLTSTAMRVAMAYAALTSLSCVDLAPPLNVPAELSKFQVRDSTAATDSLRVAFQFWENGCDRGVSPEVIAANGPATFTVWRHVAPYDGCDSNSRLFMTYRYAVPVSQRTDPFLVRFKQPSGFDSVRTVIWR